MGPWTEPGLALCVHRQTLAGLKDHSSRSPTGNGKPVLLSTLSSAVGLSQGKPCIGGRVSPGPLSYLRLYRGCTCGGNQPLAAAVLQKGPQIAE